MAERALRIIGKSNKIIEIEFTFNMGTDIVSVNYYFIYTCR